eukprot:1098383-Ditylum_brightwellii.AAC.1
MELLSHDMMELEVPGEDPGTTDSADLDLHADTGIGGANVAMIDGTGERVPVNTFSPEHEVIKDTPLASVAGAYACPTIGHTILLGFPQWLYFSNRMPHSLVNVNQIQEQGHKVKDCPKQFDRGSSHSIKTKDEIKIPLSMKGVISYIPMHKPMESELDSYKIDRIEMTSDSL